MGGDITHYFTPFADTDRSYLSLLEARYSESSSDFRIQ